MSMNPVTIGRIRCELNDIIAMMGMGYSIPRALALTAPPQFAMEFYLDKCQVVDILTRLVEATPLASLTAIVDEVIEP